MLPNVRDEALDANHRLNLYIGHVAAFLLGIVVMVGVDVTDGASGSTFLGLDWAHWVLIPWAVVIAVHSGWFFSALRSRPLRFTPRDPRPEPRLRHRDLVHH